MNILSASMASSYNDGVRGAYINCHSCVSERSASVLMHRRTEKHPGHGRPGVREGLWVEIEEGFA